MTDSTNVAGNSAHSKGTLEDIKDTGKMIEFFQLAEGKELSDCPYKGLNP